MRYRYKDGTIYTYIYICVAGIRGVCTHRAGPLSLYICIYVISIDIDTASAGYINVERDMDIH